MADVPNCPRGRIEELLAKMAGLPNDAPTTPWSREEAYLLKIIESGGGGGPTVVQTTGQSTTDVMSQKAVTDVIGDVESILQILNSGNGAQ